jgi:thiamine pyrophosphokinase
MEELKLTPDVVVGDFDTVSADLVIEYKKQHNITFIELKPEKDKTDTESAIDYVISLGYNEVVLLAAMGKRFDHTLANLNMLYRLLQLGVKGMLVDEYNHIYLIASPLLIESDKLYGKYVSLLPFTDEVKNLTLKGFKYPLYNFCLTKGSSIGISNEVMTAKCSIVFDEGVLIVVEARD